MDRFLVITNSQKDPGFQVTDRVKAYLENNGKNCYIETKGDGREERHQRKLIVGDRDRDLAALLRKIFGTGQIIAAHVDGLVKGVELVLT